MNEVIEKIGNVDYSIGKMDALKQFHVARRLAPLLAGLVGSFKDDQKLAGDVPPEQAAADAFKDFDLTPIAEALSKMDDASCEYIIFTCLSAVQRHDGASWCRVVSQGNRLMYKDMDANVLMQLTVAVVKENIVNFFPGGQPSSAAEKTSTSS